MPIYPASNGKKALFEICGHFLVPIGNCHGGQLPQYTCFYSSRCWVRVACNIRTRERSGALITIEDKRNFGASADTACVMVDYSRLASDNQIMGISFNVLFVFGKGLDCIEEVFGASDGLYLCPTGRLSTVPLLAESRN